MKKLPVARPLYSLLTLGCLAMISLTLAGCDASSKISKANYDQVTNGMTESEVEAILGAPTQQGGANVNLPSANVAGLDLQGGKFGSTTKTWTQGSDTITVQFVNDKVFTKVWAGK